ncbi:transcription termination factor 1 [Lagopus muta]|uniref:transcription termination factor 1 n=1 Tax=Lagopus muta TaxID=64668 RepID=UPI0020A1CA2E|nr:transcription termination factor 1 [Lagopus muta]
MREKANGDDFPIWDSHKKKKRKRKRFSEDHENGSIQDAELSCASTQLSEDHAGQSSEVAKKKKKKKKKREEQQHLLENSLAELECEVGSETVVDASRKKKKRRKWKLNESMDSHGDVACVPVNQDCVDSCQEDDADNVCFKKSVKKKRKRKVPEEDGVSESPASETHGNKRPKKKKRRVSSTQDTQEDSDANVDLSLLTCPGQKKQQEGMESPSTTGEGGVAASQCRGSACGASAVSEDPTDEPTDFSKPAAEAKKSSRWAAKVIKSRTYITEDSSSDSDAMTPETTTSSKKEDQNNSFTETTATDELSLDDEEFLHMVTVLDLDTARQELEEFIPHVGQLSDHSIRKMAGRDLLRFKQFKRQGIAIKFGRFTQKENNQIRKNVEEFLSITGIDSAEKLLFTSRYPEEKEAINRLKAEHRFCEKLAEGIPRAWRLIYYRARKIFDPNNYKGRYTKEEKEKLKRYHALHGNDWKKIAEMMSRSNLSVAMKYSEIKSQINYGPWSKEEIRKLMHAVEEVMVKRASLENANSLSSSKKSHRSLQIDREKLFEKLPWTEIETKVGTRYWRQCKQKWTSILTNKITKGQQLHRGTKRLQASINLIKRLYEMKVEDANEVKWQELSGIIGDVPGSYVQAKFYKLKVSYVPFWREKTFSEIIDYLFEKTLPEFEQKLEKRKGKQSNSTDSTVNPKKQVFQLSDVFDSSEESDD